MEFDVLQGDIAEQEADALVNAAGTSLEMGSGVAGALKRAANGPIEDEAVSNGPIELGTVAVTDAYDLDAEYVIHAAAMPHNGDGTATVDSIMDATQNALEMADELECESIVFPILGTGVAGVDFETGVRTMVSVVSEFSPDTLDSVTLIAYADEEYSALVSIAEEAILL